MFPVLVYFYSRLAKQEEKLIRKEFGSAYDEYARNVPAFFPNLKTNKKNSWRYDMNAKLNPIALGTAAAIVAALSMLVLGIFGNIGIYTGAVDMMRQWHMFFSLTPLGIITGMIEAAVISFVFLYLFGWIYNKLV
jgi:hypothetical protein